MKIFRMLGRSIRDAFKSVFRNFSLSLASISCITITLIIVAVSMVASYNVEHFSKVIQKDVTMVVFLNNEITQEEIDDLSEKINSLDNIETCDFKSKEQSKEEMMSESDVFEGIMGTWNEEDNPLKDSFLIKVKDINHIKDTADTIKSLDKVDVVNYGEEMVGNLISAFKAVEKISVIAVVALIVVTVFLIINTIKLTIFSRKREISIMRLVGASNFTIKTPFIVEGMVLGLIGSIIPVLIVIYGYTLLFDHFDGVLYSSLIQMVNPQPFVYLVSILVIIIGMLVGMIGSASAVRKYLKV